MTFTIRTVDSTRDKPCEEARPVIYQKEVRARTRDENGDTIYQINYEADTYWVVDIESLEELVELSRRVDNPLIISYDTTYGVPESCKDIPNIEIYDGYRE